MLTIPTHCPICNSKLIIEQKNNSKVLKCINPQCSGQFRNRIIHAISARALDIVELSKKTIDRLIDYGWLNSLEDIYKLHSHKDEWIKKDGFGEQSVTQILNEIEKSKNTELWRILVAAGIPNVEKSTAKEIVKVFPTWDLFISSVKTYDFTQINGFGEKMSKSIREFDYSEIEKIIPYLSFTSQSSGSLSGKVFCITGALSRKRDDIVKDIEAAGGQVASGVNKNTDYLVCNTPSSSSKYKNAIKLGIEIITEEDLLRYIK